MANSNEFDYIEAKEPLNLPVIQITDVKSFIRFANASNVNNIFKTVHEDGKTVFFFPLSGVAYKIEADSYITLADMQQAQSRSFPSAKEYYEAEKAGFGSYQEYMDLSKTGIENKPDYEASYKGGFVDGFPKFKLRYEHYRNFSHKDVIPPDIDNPVRLHKYAQDKGINTYVEFEKIYNAGFPDQLTYSDAHAKGFYSGLNYYDAVKKGFSEAKEFQEAGKLHIDTKKEYDEYLYLKNLNQHRDYSFDQLQLLVALSRCDNGMIIPIPEVKKLLHEAQEKYRKPSGTEGHRILPMWYSRKLDKEENLLSFLKSNEELKKFGFFNTEKKAFEIFKASSIRIFVDASNVAHNNKGDKVKPEIRNIRELVKELRFWKFKNITVIADASLRHKVRDLHLLEELRKECDYAEAPKGTSADEFLIQSVKKEKCFVVSNDGFDDWKRKDSWVRDNMDKNRIKFTVTREYKAILNNMDQFREKMFDE